MKERTRGRLPGAFVLFWACLVFSTPALALVQHTDGTPPDMPDARVVGRWRHNASAVAIGPNHILTARHQGGTSGGSVFFSNGSEMVQYIIGELRTPNQDGLENADLRIARIWTTDGKPANLSSFVGLYTSGTELSKPIVMGGYGKGRGSELTTTSGKTYGYTWYGVNNGTQRWGTNYVSGVKSNYAVSSYVSDTILLDFDDIGTGGCSDYESACAEWDSGGGWFIFDSVSEEWKLAGITAYADPGHAVGETWFRNPYTGKLRPDKNYAIRISQYDEWISQHSATWEVLPGDANLDGLVDVGDLGILGSHYGETVGVGWTEGDFNTDGEVNVGDLAILGAHYQDGGGFPLTPNGPCSTIPEPSSMVLLVCSLAALRRRRGGRR